MTDTWQILAIAAISQRESWLEEIKKDQAIFQGLVLPEFSYSSLLISVP